MSESEQSPLSRENELRFTGGAAEERPCKARDLVLIGTDRQDRFVFLSPQGPGWAALSPAASRLLSLCDGHRTIADLEALVRFPETLGGRDSPVTSLVKIFHDCCVLESSRSRSEQRGMRKPLRYVALYLTNACNLKCRFCFYSAGRPSPDELTTAEYVRLIDDLAAARVGTVYLMGGEPLLRSDVFHIARHARSRGLVTALVTNGTLVTENVASEIAESFTFVQVSLDGLEDANDAIRGKNGFHRASKGIALLLNRGCDIRIATVVSRLNVDHLERFLSRVVEMGVNTVHFINLQECGRGKKSRIGVPAKEFFAGLLPAWNRWRHVLGRSNALNYLLPVRGFQRTHCGVANGMVEIDARGEVFGCYKYMEKRVSQDNVRVRSIAEIYDTSPALNGLRYMSVLDHPMCRICHFRFLCGGDCMAVAKLNGNTGQVCEIAELYRWILTEAEIPEVRVSVSQSELHA